MQTYRVEVERIIYQYTTVYQNAENESEAKDTVIKESRNNPIYTGCLPYMDVHVIVNKVTPMGELRVPE